MTLTPDQARELSALLGRFQTRHLEPAVISCLIGGYDEDPAVRSEAILTGPIDEVDRESVAQDRADWRTAEEWVKRLEVSC